MTPVAVPLELTVALVLEPGAVLATVRAAAEAALHELLFSAAEPSTALALSRISEAISTTAGEKEHEITSPLTNPDPGNGSIFTEVDITWS